MTITDERLAEMLPKPALTDHDHGADMGVGYFSERQMIQFAKAVSRHQSQGEEWQVTDEMVEAGLAHYSEGGCMGLAEHERREVVVDILTTALRNRTQEPQS